ncbi:MAG: ComEC/Rec2 family competence protein [Anaerolineae bacterium]|nr:ComEC/Rec2 family competence protein [Anaerolineae bacterium]
MRLVYVTLAWAAGILFAANLSAPLPVGWLFATSLALASLALVWRQRPQRSLHILLAALALGGLRFALAPHTSDVAAHNGHALTVEGTVVEAPQQRSDGLQLRVAAETVTYGGRTQATSGIVLVDTPNNQPIAFGDHVRATGDQFQPPTYDTFSYADYLARAGIFSLMPNAAVEVVEPNTGFSLSSLLVDLREQARDRIDDALPEPYAGLLTGILIGDESQIAPDIEDAFSRTGASHVIAISGFNMVVVSGIVLAVLKRVKVSDRRAALISIGVVVIYTLFVGASASVVRAAVMSSLWIAGSNILQRRTFVPASLAFAALLMSLINPYVLWDVGFQLSLFATLGITLFTTPLTRWLRQGLAAGLPERWAESITGWLAPTLIVSLAAQVLVLPLIALYFERISFVSLAVNLLILPVQPLILTVGGLATIVALIVPGVGLLGFYAVLPPLAWTIGVVRRFAELPFAEVAVQFHPSWVTLFFVIAIGWAIMQAAQPEWIEAAARFARRSTVRVGAIAAALVLLVLIGLLVAARPDGKLHLWLLEMGHNNAILAQTPGGAQILIDGGHFPSRLLLTLGDHMALNDREIDLVAITEPDDYDYGALPDVLQRYHAGMIVTNGQPSLSRTHDALLEAAGDTPIRALCAGQTITFSDGVEIEVLSPAAPPALGEPMDDSPLVMRLSYGDASFLIPSDASDVAQDVMVEMGDIAPATALILPKHGAARALEDDFLQAVRPQIALLQADPANRIGDPDPDTLAQVEDIPLYRTDVMGALHLWTDGSTMWLLPQAPL